MQYLITFAAVFGATIAVVIVAGGWAALLGYASFATPDSSPRQRRVARFLHGRRWNDDSTRGMVISGIRAAVIFVALFSAAATAIVTLTG